MEGVADLSTRSGQWGSRNAICSGLTAPDRSARVLRKPIQNRSTKVSATCANIGIKMASIDMAPSETSNPPHDDGGPSL